MNFGLLLLCLIHLEIVQFTSPPPRIPRPSPRQPCGRLGPPGETLRDRLLVPGSSSENPPVPRTGCSRLDKWLGTGADLNRTCWFLRFTFIVRLISYYKQCKKCKCTCIYIYIYIHTLIYRHAFACVYRPTYIDILIGIRIAPSRAKRIFWSSTPSVHEF